MTSDIILGRGGIGIVLDMKTLDISYILAVLVYIWPNEAVTTIKSS
jgi:hypothetical protein